MGEVAARGTFAVSTTLSAGMTLLNLTRDTVASLRDYRAICPITPSRGPIAQLSQRITRTADLPLCRNRNNRNKAAFEHQAMATRSITCRCAVAFVEVAGTCGMTLCRASLCREYANLLVSLALPSELAAASRTASFASRVTRARAHNRLGGGRGGRHGEMVWRCRQVS